MKEKNPMAKKKTAKKKERKVLHPFDVYQQADGALLAMSAEDVPEYELDPVWSGNAVDERDAIKQARASNKKFRKAVAADSDQEPDASDSVRKQAEEATNRRLGITKKSTKRAGKKKSTRKVAATRTKKKAARKTTRRRGW
jgi:hypothetical protein